MPLDKLNLPKEDYQQLCSKAIADKLSPAEKIQLEAWLDQSKKNRIYYNDIKRLWQQTDWSVPPETPDIHDEWHHLAHSLSLQAKKKTKQGALVLDRIQRFIISLHGRYRIVLALAALILLITGIYFLQFLSKPSIYTLSTQSAEKKYIRLPDGSDVWLNSESSLKYPEKFSTKKRVIHLTGEAFLNVVHNQSAFVIMTKNACTEVLGTAFNVWSRHDETRIIVKNGKVRLKRSPHDTLQVEIVRNQMSRVTQQLPPEKPNTVNADQKIGWMEGRLVFEKTTLIEIIEEIERYYGIRINLLDETLARETLTASYNNTSLSNVLQSLSLSCGTNYRYLSEQQIDFGMSAKDM